MVEKCTKIKRFFRQYVRQTAEMNASGGQIWKNPFSFGDKSGIMRPRHKGVQSSRGGTDSPCVFSECIALADYRTEAVKRGENIYEIRSSYFAPQLPGSCRCHLRCAGPDGLRRLVQLCGSFLCRKFHGFLCGWHRSRRHPEHHAGDRGPVAGPAGGHRWHLV